LALLGLGSLVVLWILVSASGLVEPLFLPSPAEVCEHIYELFRHHKLIADISTSIFRVMCGFLAAAALAVPAGLTMGSFKSAEALLQPLIEFIRYMPVPAFLPLCILWFGIGDVEKVMVIFIGTFFQLVILVADDARSVPEEMLEIGYSVGFGRMNTLWKIVLPGAAPQIFDHLRVSCGWAWSYLVVAEVVAANKGVGFMIMQAQRYLRTADVIGGILIIGVLGLLSDFAFKLAGVFFFPWEYRKA
jgi:NitT/TauT family transport system permease protein